MPKALEKELIDNIVISKEFIKIRKNALNALKVIFQSPVISVSELYKVMEISYNTASKLIVLFMKIGILKEIRMQKRNRLYQFTAYLKMLERDYSVE